jgi:hypothetical protein
MALYGSVHVLEVGNMCHLLAGCFKGCKESRLLMVSQWLSNIDGCGHPLGGVVLLIAHDFGRKTSGRGLQPSVLMGRNEYPRGKGWSGSCGHTL